MSKLTERPWNWERKINENKATVEANLKKPGGGAREGENSPNVVSKRQKDEMEAGRLNLLARFRVDHFELRQQADEAGLRAAA